MKDTLNLHLLLYSKDWYQTTDVLNDLRTIISKCRDVHARNSDIWILLLELAVKIDAASFAKDFLQSAFNGGDYNGMCPFDMFRGAVDLTFERAVKKVLGWLSVQTVTNIEKAGIYFSGEPDKKILPLTK